MPASACCITAAEQWDEDGSYLAVLVVLKSTRSASAGSCRCSRTSAAWSIGAKKVTIVAGHMFAVALLSSLSQLQS
jgi:hypothetical protein